MDILFLLIPLSVLLVFALMGVFAWALQSSQFDDLRARRRAHPRRRAADT